MFEVRIQRAVDVLWAGGVVAYPTEAVYGLGCLPLAANAVARLLTIKRRPVSKGLILIAADLEQIQRMVRIPGGAIGEEIMDSWPGPVTWLLEAQPWVPRSLTGGRDTLAVRITDHALAARLCERAGSALVSTSANRSGQPPLRSALTVRLRLGREIDYLLPGPLGGRARPSEIRDGRTGQVVRPS